MSLFGTPVRRFTRARATAKRTFGRGRAGSTRRRAGSAALYASLLVVLAGAGVAIAETFETGRIGPSLGITANGRVLHPIGRLTPCPAARAGQPFEASRERAVGIFFRLAAA